MEEILETYKHAIDAIIDRLDTIQEEVNIINKKYDDISTTIFNEILTPVSDEMKRRARDVAFSEFKENYGSRLEPYDSALKAVEGDDFDIYNKAFDDYTEKYSDMDADSYIDGLTEKIDEQLELIKEKLGASEVVVEQNSDGETTIVADGEEVAPEEITPDNEVISEDEDTSDPEELAKYEEELKNL